MASSESSLSETVARPWVYVLPRQMPAEVWHRLARALVVHESWFGLAWRRGTEWSERAKGIRAFLRPMRVEQRLTGRWPGTRLFGHQATVTRYRTCPAVLTLLLSTDDPFAWLSPELPEDLFFGSHDRLAFVSVAHERQAWLLGRRYARLVGQDITLTRERLDARDSQLVRGALQAL